MADWQAIASAPRDGTDILVWHRVHGAMTARFCPGEWHDHHEYGRQYDGPVWCFGDDVFQEEVEEELCDNEQGKTWTVFHDGPVTHWQASIHEPIRT